MATIQKRGNTYKITVSCGYDMSGRQIRKTTTWQPEETLTARQLEKELNRQATLFEEKCKSGNFISSNIKFAEFLEIWFKEYAEKQLKEKTIVFYRAMKERIKNTLGNLRLDRIQPQHLMSFYDELSKSETAKSKRFKASDKLIELLSSMQKVKIRELTKLSNTTITDIIKGKNFAESTKLKLIDGLKISEKYFIKQKIDKKLSPKTVLHYHRFISSVLNTAVYWQIILSNPAARVKAPRVQQTEAKYLTDTEVVKMLDILDTEDIQFKTMINLLIYSGMRRGEMLGLKWEDIDFNTNQIDITKALLYTPHKGVYLDTPKNKKSVRKIYLPKSVMDMLNQYRRYQLEEKLKLGDKWIDTGFVFTSWNGDLYRPDTLTNKFKDFATRNGFEDVHIHSLRHTNATLLITTGADIRTISNRLGHTQTSTTGNIYAHALMTADKSAVEGLEKLISKNA